MPTTNGSPIYRDHVPAADAWVVERLRNLGATIFGKTVSTEFAWRQPGPTVNPWNSQHTPGGSSSGSAAAVAAGIVPLALGTPDAGLGGPAGRLQRRGRLQAEFWRDPAHRRASSEPVARSRRLLCATRRRRGVCAVAARGQQRSRSPWPAASRLPCRYRSGPAAARQAAACHRPFRQMGARPSRSSRRCSTPRSRHCAMPARSSKSSNWPRSTHQLERDQHHSRQRRRRDLRRSRRALSRSQQRSSEVAGRNRQGPFRDRLPRRQGAAGQIARRPSPPTSSGFDAVLTLPAFGEAPKGLQLYRRRRILRALDPARRPRSVAAGRLRQERLAFGNSDRRPVSGRLPHASRRQMGRRRAGVQSGNCEG